MSPTNHPSLDCTVNQVFLPIAPESSLFWAVGLLSPPTFAMGIDQVNLDF